MKLRKTTSHVLFRFRWTLFLGFGLLAIVLPVLAAPGDLDPTFSDDGILSQGLGPNSDESGEAVAIDTTGKIIVAGLRTTTDGDDFAAIRLNQDGTLDASFGVGGGISSDLGNNRRDVGEAAALDENGRLVIAGLSNLNGSNDFAVVRYQNNGTLDTSFGENGFAITDLGQKSRDDGKAVVIAPNGNIIVVGRSNANGNNDFAIVRYSRDGTLDSTFDSDGTAILDIAAGSNDNGKAVTVDEAGKIIVAGSSDEDFALIRLNPDGSLDSSFGNGGIVTTDFGGGSQDVAESIAIDAGGKLVVVGVSDRDGSDDFALARYNTNGSLDDAFGTKGLVVTSLGNNSKESARALTIDSRSKIIVAGVTNRARSDDFALARYNADGSLDPSFHGDGITITDINNASNDTAKAIALDANGNIVVAGFSRAGGNDDFAVVRYEGSSPATTPTVPATTVTPTVEPKQSATPTQTEVPESSPTPTMTGSPTATTESGGTIIIPEPTPTLPSSDRTIVTGPDIDKTTVYTDADDKQVIITIPKGAVDQPTTLLFKRVDTVSTGDDLFEFAGRAFTLTAYQENVSVPNFTFQQPITIIVEYDHGDVATIDETQLSLYFYDTEGNRWSNSDITLLERDTNANRLTVQLTHLTEFALGVRLNRVLLPAVLR